MLKENKCLEYYLDSKMFSRDMLQDIVNKAKKEFPEKQVEPKLYLNNWGVYILKIEFTDKDNYLNRRKQRKRNRKILMLNEKNEKIKEKRMQEELKKAEQDNKQYGQYKETKTYKPF